MSEIQTTFPQLSKIGSQDDMSIAMIFDSDKVCSAIPEMIEWQIANVKRAIADESVKIEKANKIQQSLESVEHPTRQNMIDLQYANADEKRAIEARTKLQGRLDTLLKELSGDNSSEDASVNENVVIPEDEASDETSPDNTELSNGTE